jgi:hypothetical protein
VTGTFVRDVTVAVQIVELAGPPEVFRCVFVAESTLFGTLGLRWRAHGILVGVERKSRHWGTSEEGEAIFKPEAPLAPIAPFALIAPSPKTAPLTPEEATRLAERATLSLARTRAMVELQCACAPAHRAMLEQAIADLDRRIASLENPKTQIPTPKSQEQG